MPIAFPGVNINEQQKVRDSLSNFAKALSGLAEQKQLQKRNALLSQIFQPEPTTTSDDIAFNSPESVATGNFGPLPTSNPSAIDPSQSVRVERPLTRVEQIKQREGTRKKAYDTILLAHQKAGLPMEKAEAYFKFIDRKIPEIKAREVEATDTITGNKVKVLETHPGFATGELILGTEPTKQTLTYFDKAGTKRQIRVPEAQFNQVENAIVSSGGRLDKEDKTPLQEAQDYADSLPEGSKKRAQAELRVDKMISSQKTDLSFDPETGAFSYSQGSESSLTKPTETKLQKDVVGLEQQLEDLRVLGKDFKRSYLTYGGKIKRFALREASKAGVDIGEGGREFLQGARMLQEGVEQVFNAYRKEITGAQAAIKEIKMLRDSILNKELAPDEFEPSYNRYINQVQRHLSLKKYFLSKGITGEELNRKLDAGAISGETSIDLRGDEIELELVQKGIPEDQIQTEVLKQLKAEGLF